MTDTPERTRGRLSPAILYGSKDPRQWSSLDVYGNFQYQRGPTGGFKPRPHRRRQGPCKLLWNILEMPLLLVLIGSSSALVSYGLSSFLRNDFRVRNIWLQSLGFSWASLGVYTLAAALMAGLACLTTHVLCPEAAGSGVPEMRVVLSGALKPVLLAPRMLAAKACGLCLALLSGLHVGKEGPYIHIACIIANLFMGLSWFHNMMGQDSKRLDVLACACAAGVAATFGTPFGGVLFSVEVTSDAYMTRNLPRAAFCAVAGSMMYAAFNVEDSMALFRFNDAKYTGIGRTDLGLLAVLAMSCGLLGAGFTGILDVLTKKKLRFLQPPGRTMGPGELLARKMLICMVGAALVAPLTFYDISYGLHGDNRTLTDSLFQDHTLGLSTSLITFPLYKLVVTLISVLLPLPVGLFAPVFLTGAAIGRVAGEACSLLKVLGASVKIEPWEFAVVGAAAFTTGVTRAISVAVIIFELSDEGHLRLPVSLAVILAYFVAQRLTPNVYDALADSTGTPYLPRLPDHARGIPVHNLTKRLKPSDVLDLENSTYGDARKLLLGNLKTEVFAIVRNKRSMELVGRVFRGDMASALQRFESHHQLSVAPRPAIFRGVAGNGVHQMFEYDIDNDDIVDIEHLARSESFVDLLDARIQFQVEHDGQVVAYTEDTYLLATNAKRQTSGGFSSDFERSLSASDMKLSETFSVDVSKNADVIVMLMDPFPYQMDAATPLTKVDQLFRLLRLGNAFVTHKGRLYGIIVRDDLRVYLGENAKKPVDRLVELCGAFCGSCTSQRHRGYDPIPGNR